MIILLPAEGVLVGGGILRWVLPEGWEVFLWVEAFLDRVFIEGGRSKGASW